MRLYLLPVSSRRTLLYAQRLNIATTDQQGWSGKIQARVARTWAAWEKKDGGWQKKIVEYGNYAFRRIPYEEWGLKSVPPLSASRKAEEVEGSNKVEVVYPQSLIPLDKVSGILHTLSTERESLHKRRLLWCFVGMPISAPFALIPVIPNLPFFYLAYRAWSHWHALSGGKHLQFLLQNKLLIMKPSPILDAVYAKQKGPLPSSPEPTTSPGAEQLPGLNPEDTPHPEGETMLLSQTNGKKMTQELDLPELEIELERAIWQVEGAIKKQNAEDVKKSSEATPPEKSEGPEEREKKSQ